MSQVMTAVRGERMAVIVVAVVVLAVAAAEDYDVGSMPLQLYGGGDYGPEYLARSPDASAPLDYKLREEPRSEISEAIEERAGRRHRPRPRPRRPRPAPRHRPDYDDDDPHDTTVRLLDRKVRQRAFAPPPPEPASNSKPEDDFLLYDEEERSMRPLKPEDKDDNIEYPSGDERRDPAAGTGPRRRPAGRARGPPPAAPAPRSEHESDTGSENEGTLREWGPPRPAPGNYPDYRDSLTEKNVQNKLPTLLRRPSSTTPRATQAWYAAEPRPWGGRRAGDVGVPSDTTPASTAPTTAPPAPPAVPAAPAANNSEASMADKSRLSILKKAQLKEIARSGPLRKPPVLLHVSTAAAPTVVVVAQVSGDPWHRARPVSGDSPATLDKVKRLMRQKLVAGAKSIRDLTDNWDQNVCDYIDVDLLESVKDTAPFCGALPPLLVAVLLLARLVR